MPRPGPRPYECVRRAWHSDRHQPMRGSVIGEMFRVVIKKHSSATRKNKEWQDKLPIVVLKAEEIMYSKANSEAEYMDLETLWDRANDAINTIIRLDDSTETGVFLQPCIEAALNLGCTPTTPARSQRNNTSTYYLNIKNTKRNLCPSNKLHKTTQFVAPYSQIMKPHSINVSPFNLNPQVQILPNESLRNKFSFPCPPTAKAAPSVYPLYYGNGIEHKDPKITYDEPKENDKMRFIEKPLFINEASKSDTNVGDLRFKSEEHSEGHECDLSLRLGPSQHCDFNNSKKWSFETGNLDVEARMKKQKVVVSNLYENLHLCLQPNVSYADSNGGSMTNAGL